MASRLRTFRRRRRRGTMLIAAMIIVFAIAAMVLTLAQAMRVEATAAANAAAAREAGAVERAAEQYVLALLAQRISEPAAEPLETLDASYYEAVAVGNGWFWLVRPGFDDPALPAWGICDESARLDLNAVSYERLIELPGMTEDLAASIIDWRDDDDTPTEGRGAESQVYLARTPGHEAKNAPFETVEELLLVEGMTPELLYGELQEPAGDAASGLGTGGAFEGRAFESERYRVHGLFDYFTVRGGEAATALDGSERLNVNDDERREELRELFAEVFGATRGNELGNALPGGNLLDLFDLALRTGMTPLELAEIEDRLVVNVGDDAAAVARSKVNVNWAPRELLLTVPTLDEADVDALISRRQTAVHDDPHSIAWVLEALPNKALGLGRYLTGRGACYSADIVAVSGNGRAFRRVRIVVDTSAAEPVIVYRRDLTEQGWPLDSGILTSLRSGESPTAGVAGPLGGISGRR